MSPFCFVLSRRNRYLTSLYAVNHATMHEGISCTSGEADFANGIIHGTELYTPDSEEDGSLIDFSYIHSNVMEIGLDLSCCNHLPASELPQEWMNNKEALLKFMEASHLGIKAR